MKILAICSKSGVGKSTLIDKIATQLKRTTYVVRSLSTRKPRDEFDLFTHTFVSNRYYEAHKEDAISTYHAPQGYYNWTDASCFDKEKINLYAIDSKAVKEELYDKCKEYGWDLEIIYLKLPEEIRKERWIKREGSLDGFSEEEHLSIDYLINFYASLNVIDANTTLDNMVNETVEVIEQLLEK